MIRIQTFKQWTRSYSLVGVSDTPIKLLVKIIDDRNQNFVLNDICISVKRNFILFKTLRRDILKQKINKKATNKINNEYSLDLRNIALNYNEFTYFTVKVLVNGKSFESEPLTLSELNV